MDLLKLYMPHRVCLSEEWLIWGDIITNLLTASAYFLIPLTLWYIAHHTRWKLPNIILFSMGLFIVFITLCGMTHVMNVVEVNIGVYRLSLIIDSLCAIVSVVTSILFFRSAQYIVNLVTNGKRHQFIREIFDVLVDMGTTTTAQHVADMVETLDRDGCELVLRVLQRKYTEDILVKDSSAFS